MTISSLDFMNNEYLLCVIVGFIILYNNERERTALTRSALLSPKLSPWKKLLWEADESSFFTMTGFSRYSFNILVEIVFPSSEISSSRVGRPSMLDNHDKIGLALLYLGSKMSLKHMSMIFGILPSSISMALREILRRLRGHLKSNAAAQVLFPDDEKMSHLARLVQEREPAVSNVIGFADGLCLNIECSEDEEAQAEYYNGHHKATMVNNVLAFSAEGKIIHATVNCPGSWHDSQVAVHLMAIVEKRIRNYCLCVDQGFCKSDYMQGKFVGSISKRTLRAILKNPTAENRKLLDNHETFVSLRQAAEWGMRALQGTFARLKTKLSSNRSFRKLIITSVIFLHNFRTHYIGLNQIATVFNPQYEQYISLQTYDRIARYFQS